MCSSAALNCDKGICDSSSLVRSQVHLLATKFPSLTTVHAGNHCLYNLPRRVLNERLGMGKAEGASYYAFQPHPQWRFIVLDGYDVSLLGWTPEHPNHQLALQTLNERNPNEVGPQHSVL